MQAYFAAVIRITNTHKRLQKIGKYWLTIGGCLINPLSVGFSLLQYTVACL